jgi:hypothetical protein
VRRTNTAAVPAKQAAKARFKPGFRW